MQSFQSACAGYGLEDEQAARYTGMPKSFNPLALDTGWKKQLVQFAWNVIMFQSACAGYGLEGESKLQTLEEEKFQSACAGYGLEDSSINFLYEKYRSFNPLALDTGWKISLNAT